MDKNIEKMVTQTLAEEDRILHDLEDIEGNLPKGTSKTSNSSKKATSKKK